MPKRAVPRWTQEQEQSFRRAWNGGTPLSKVAKRLGRSEVALRKKAQKMGLLMRGAERWTADEDAIVRDACGRLVAQLARALQRPKQAVIKRSIRAMVHHDFVVPADIKIESEDA